MANASDISRDEERRLLKEWAETTSFDKEYSGIPPMAPDPDDDEDERE